MPRAAIPLVVLVAIIALVVALLSGDGPAPATPTTEAENQRASAGEFDAASEAAESFESEEAAAPAAAVIPPPVDLEAADRDLDLFGRVIDTEDRPIPGAKIEVLHYPGRRVNAVDAEAFARITVIHTLLSASDGSFSVRLPRGAIRGLRVTHPQYGEVEHRQCLAGEQIEIVLFPPATIDLLVVDEDGQPIAFADLRTFVSAFELYSCDRTGITDTEGRARFESMPPGDFHIEVQHPEFQSHWEDVTTVAGETAAREVVLRRGRSVSGVVTDSISGEPIAGAQVAVDWPMKRAVRTDEHGRYSLIGMRETGPTEVYAEADGYGRGFISAVPAGNSAGGDPSAFVADLELIPGNVVVGTLVDPDGAPVAGATVFATATVSTHFQLTASRRGDSDADGRFRIDSLHPELAHTLIVLAPGFGRYLLDFGPELADANRRIDLGKIVLPLARSIEGVVVDENGEPYAGERISISGHNFDRFLTREGPGPMNHGDREERRTDDLGRFRFPDQSPGFFMVQVQIHGRPIISRGVDLRGSGPDPHFVEIVVERGAETLVRVEDNEGTPLSGVWVTARDIDRERMVSAVTKSDGIVRLGGITGKLAVRVLGSQDYAASPPFELVAGGPLHVVVLSPSAWVRGVVLDPDGNRLGGMVIAVTCEGETERFPAEPDGTFALRVEEGQRVDLRANGRQMIPDEDSFQGMAPHDTPFQGKLLNLRAPAEEVELILERIEEGRSIAVRFVDEEGNGLAGALVALRDSEGSRGFADGKSDAEGWVRWSDLLAVECGIHLVRPPETPPPPGQGWIRLEYPKLVPDGQTLELVIPSGPIARVRVEDPDGGSAVGVLVRFETNLQRTGARTVNDGWARFPLFEGEVATVWPELRGSPGDIVGERVSGVVGGGDPVTLTLDSP